MEERYPPLEEVIMRVVSEDTLTFIG